MIIIPVTITWSDTPESTKRDKESEELSITGTLHSTKRERDKSSEELSMTGTLHSTKRERDKSSESIKQIKRSKVT